MEGTQTLTTGGPRQTPRCDLGIEVVDELRRRADAAELHCVAWPRGFSWTPLVVAQRVWSEPDFSGGARPSWRVQVRSAIASGFEATPAQLHVLSELMTASALSAVVRDEDDRSRLELASTVHVHAGNAHRAADLVGFVACLQAAQVESLASTAAVAGLHTPAGLAQPGRDLPSQPAPDCAAIADGTTRRLDTRVWPAQEMRACVERLVASPGARAVSTPQGLTASFASNLDLPGGGLTLLQVDTRAERPGLGPGLSVMLVAPGRGGVREALALNEREVLPGWQTDLLGGWVVDGSVLQHAAFYPDAVYREGLLADIVETAIRRVDSIRRR